MPGSTPMRRTRSSPLARIVAAIRVKSPFSHKRLVRVCRGRGDRGGRCRCRRGRDGGCGHGVVLTCTGWSWDTVAFPTSIMRGTPSEALASPIALAAHMSCKRGCKRGLQDWCTVTTAVDAFRRHGDPPWPGLERRSRCRPRRARARQRGGPARRRRPSPSAVRSHVRSWRCWSPPTATSCRPTGSRRNCGVTTNPPIPAPCCRATSPGCARCCTPRRGSSRDRPVMRWRSIRRPSTRGASRRTNSAHEATLLRPR